jgi:predicted N-acetyltransferase YhbS
MISVRNYRSSDYESIKDLYLQSSTFGGLFDEDRDSVERLNKQSESDPESILVAEENGKVIGTVSILENMRFAWLMRFAVKNELASKALFERSSEILKKRGHLQVLVYAPSNEKQFIDRYKNLNFKIGSKNYVAFWKSLS